MNDIIPIEISFNTLIFCFIFFSYRQPLYYILDEEVYMNKYVFMNNQNLFYQSIHQHLQCLDYISHFLLKFHLNNNIPITVKSCNNRMSSIL